MSLLVICIVHVGVEDVWPVHDTALPVLSPRVHLVPADCMFYVPHYQ